MPLSGLRTAADVLIDGSKIAAVGPNLKNVPATAAVIDASESIVMPGLVDTHRHMWEGQMRGILPDGRLSDYTRDITGAARTIFRPEDALARAKGLAEHGFGLVGQCAFLDDADRFFNRIGNALDFHPMILDDDIGSARITIPRLADAAGVNNEFIPDFQNIGLVRMPHADHIGVYLLEPPGPENRIGVRVLVQRVSRGGVHEQETRPVYGHRLRDRQVGQEAKVFGPEPLAREHARHAGQVFEARAAGRYHVLGHRVIVVATHRVMGVLPYPVDTGRGLQSVVYQVAQAKTDIMRLVERL